jgi:hypothetical protein
MTPEELESLAIYRNHKYCQCVSCQEARKILAEYDSQPRVSGIRHRGTSGFRSYRNSRVKESTVVH